MFVRKLLKQPLIYLLIGSIGLLSAFLPKLEARTELPASLVLNSRPVVKLRDTS